MLGMVVLMTRGDSDKEEIITCQGVSCSILVALGIYNITKAVKGTT
jgi:hypothetical protein